MLEIKTKLNKYLDLKNELKEEIKIFVKNKQYSLDERWDIFVESELGDDKEWIEHFKSFPDLCESDYRNKYQTIDLIIEADCLLEAAEYHISQGVLEQYHKFREEILDKFIKTFKFDW